jgi:hypothetical protein
MPLSPRTLRPASSGFNPRQISGLALWLDGADASSLYTTDAGPVTAVSSPLDISGCVLWLDGADSSAASMTLSGSLVETWRDKSGNGNNVTASGGLRPTLTGNALNSRSVLTFGGSQGLTGNLTASISTNAYSVFVVCRISGASTNGRVFSTAGAGNDFASGSVIPCVSNAGALSAFAGTQGTNASGVTGFASYGVFAGVLSSNLVTNSAGGMSVASAAATLSTAVTRLGVGVAAQGGTGFNTCDIAEIILYPTALSTADRARVEAYLAAKWGISGVHRAARDEIAPVSSPTELAGCALWLDGDDATSMFDATSGGSQVAAGGAVARWQDKSGNGRHGVQSTSGNRPSLQVEVQNGRSVVRFDGSGDHLATTLADSSQQTFFIVSRAVSPTGGQRIFSYGADRSAFAGTSEVRWWSGNFSTGASSTSFNVAAGVIASDVSIALFGNGAAGSSGDPANAGSGLASVGSEASTVNSYNGDIAEIVVYNTALSATDRARVEKYLANKWGIANVPDPTPPVGYWGDKSGNARHAQATGANRPTVSTTTLNGRRTLGFDGSDDRLDIAALDTTPATVFSVVRHNSGTTTAARTPYAFSDGASYIHAQFIQSGASQMIGLTHNSSRSSFTADKIDVLGASFLLTSSQSSGGGGLVGRVNGSGLPFTVAVQDAGGANRVGCRFRNSANDQFWNGQIAELLVYQSDLTDAQIARVERYLASKWGITLAPIVSNADAQDWINRVYANGGTVSASTASAVNTFCDAIDFGVSGVSIRDRFYRLNLFCGGGLNACLVPLYRGQSRSGAQYGNATDSNVGVLFVSGDYSELGPNGGLAGGGARYLNTGLASNVLSAGDRHLSAYETVRSGGTFQTFLGTDEAGSQRFTLEYGGIGSTIQFGYGAFSANITVTSVSTGAHWIGVNSPDTAGQLYRNGTLEASNTQTAQTLSSRNFYVYALNRSDSATSHYGGRLGAYSIGSAMTASQAAAYYNAMQAFQTALSRNV